MQFNIFLKLKNSWKNVLLVLKIYIRYIVCNRKTWQLRNEKLIQAMKTTCSEILRRIHRYVVYHHVTNYGYNNCELVQKFKLSKLLEVVIFITPLFVTEVSVLQIVTNELHNI